MMHKYDMYIGYDTYPIRQYIYFKIIGYDTWYMNNEKYSIILTNIINIWLLMCESKFSN